MRRPVSIKQSRVWFLALALLALLLLPGVGWSETLKVTQTNQSIYPDPDFAGTPIAPVPQGAEVAVQGQSGDWYKVEYQGKSGWMNRAAFPAAEKAPKAGGLPGLPGLLFGAPVKETSSDEAALAGKGFTPEVESSYRQKHPEAKFAEVDRVEAFRVDPAKLQAFIKEGGLR